MDLNHLHLMVKDMALSQRFYETLFGFREKIWYGPKLLFLQNPEGFDLALSPSETPVSFPPGVHFGFSVPKHRDLAEMYRRGRESFPDCFPNEPKDHGDWGSLACRDPDGYGFELYWDSNLR